MTKTPAQFAITLAREAGALILEERQRAALTHSYKGGKELVTNADLKADRHICDRIAASFPGHYIVSEESSPDTDNVQSLSAPVWIIDPIDGTVNFAHGHNQSAVSIAYVEQGKVIAAVVYNPFTDELFHAELGGGAWLNGEAIGVAVETRLERAIIATGFPYIKLGLEGMLARLHAVLLRCADVRRLGSAALDICWVACGRLDGYYESLSLWDFAAARLIALEAGAVCGHFSEVPAGVDPQFHTQDLLIANASLYPGLRRLLQEAGQVIAEGPEQGQSLA
jgi:myo-inositol-1(or 4)-monophosphatase